MLEATKSVMKQDPAVYADGDVPDDEARLMLEWLNIIENVEAENTRVTTTRGGGGS